MAQQKTQPNTLEITNFGGRLTRIKNGDINSGMAKFTTSFGYDPFSKPGQLTWLESATDITGPIGDLPLTGKTTQNSGVANATAFVYDLSKKFYAIQPNSTSSPNIDSVIGISSIAANLGSLNRSASMEFFGNTLQVYIGTEKGINRANFDGSADTFIGNTNYYVQNVYRPLKKFIGKLMFGNGATIGAIDSTGTVVSTVASVAGSNSYSEISPSLPVPSYVQDLDTSLDGNYLLITGATTASERVDVALQDLQDAIVNDSAIYKWNGTDTGITAFTNLPTYLATAIQTYIGYNLFFANDAFGMSVNDENKKLLSLPGNKAPVPNATGTNGNFLTWAVPEVVGSTRYLSLYYFGSFDENMPVGLYRVLRWATTQASAQVNQVTLNMLVGNHYQTLNTSLAVATFGYGKHYLGVSSVNGSSTYQNFLLRFLITPTGSGTPQSGVYETQTQLFSKKVNIKQVRVYTEPTVTGNGFQLDLIGNDGNVISNGTFTYSFASGGNPTMLQGALERINFNPAIDDVYALGLRITNTGSTNMTFNKIEVDWDYAGK